LRASSAIIAAVSALLAFVVFFLRPEDTLYLMLLTIVLLSLISAVLGLVAELRDPISRSRNGVVVPYLTATLLRLSAVALYVSGIGVPIVVALVLSALALDLAGTYGILRLKNEERSGATTALA
jgi:hypothetical protein